MFEESYLLRTGSAPALCVWRRGRGDKCLVLLHGFASSSHIWSDWVARLPEAFRIIAIDLRGHGDSEWCPDGDYRFERHVADIEGVIDRLRLDRMVLAGHSLGGNLAIVLAARLGVKVSRLLVVDAGPGMQSAPMRYARGEYQAMPRHFASAEDYRAVLEQRHPIAERHVLGAMARAELSGADEKGFTLKSDPALANVLDSGHDDLLRASLKAVRAPMLLLRGMASSLLPRTAAFETVRLAQDGERREIDMAGHSIMLDNPEAFDRAATPFVLSGWDEGHAEPSGPGLGARIGAAD